jgi:hypothetical protein
VLSGAGSVSLTSEVSGTLGIGNGGTGLTAAGASGNILVSDGSALASVAMSGDATIASTGALTLKNTGTAGTFGSASAVPVFVTDAQGRVTSATNTNIAIAASAITSGTLGIGNGGTNNGSLSVTQGTVYYGDGLKLVGLAPGTSGQFLQTQGAGANPQWASAGSATTPYDISGEFAGTPASGATIMRFVAARTFTFGGTAYFAATSNTGATTAVFTVNVNGVSKGTVSIAGNATSGTDTIASTLIAAGDLITVVATTSANVVNPYWTLPGTV